jgi:DNA-binding NarL/FixJ family response regulator
LRCLCRGEPNKVIARELALTEGTVKIHIAAILRALQARNRTEAVVRAREIGIE